MSIGFVKDSAIEHYGNDLGDFHIGYYLQRSLKYGTRCKLKNFLQDI